MLHTGAAISVLDRQFWRKLGLRQHFAFLFSIPIYCKNTKRDGGGGIGGGGVVDSLSFDIQGMGAGVLPNSAPFGQTETGGKGAC